MTLSVVIPTRNEAAAIADTLRNVRQCCPDSPIIVVDGGSTDGTLEVAAELALPGVQCIQSDAGRGRQMNAGAAAASGDVLLFLHADTQLPLGAQEWIAEALSDTRNVGGFFRIHFAPQTACSGFLEWCYNIRSHSRIVYGDAAIFVRRSVFDSMGGYQAALLMEDVELVRRLRRRGRLAYIQSGAVTSSSRRFPDTRSALKMLGIWSLLHMLMLLHVPQPVLERIYRDVR